MNKKYTTPIFLTLVATVLFTATVSYAQYAPLAPLPIGSGGATPMQYDLSGYLSGAIKLIIALGSAIAILFTIIGGVQYIASGISPGAKKDAQDRIRGAVTGLIIILTSYLVLNSINPDLVNFKLELKKISTAPKKVVLGGWGDDASLRNELKVLGIFINKKNCVRASEGEEGKNSSETGCTSVLGLPVAAVSGVKALKEACGGELCSVMITGGTESGHYSHGFGIPNIDLQKSSKLDTYIMKFQKFESGRSCGVSTAPRYAVTGPAVGIYVLEDSKDKSGRVIGQHWHVCYR